jgi:5-methyltetrahydropteroyltriglutamate--homocysteine methyltransferase
VATLTTTVVGSYPQPDWLIDRERLRAATPPRVRARELWRVSEPLLEQAQDDATLLAVREMERAGVDVISDGEIRRESYSNHFATALEGIDVERHGTATSRSGREVPVPRVIGPIRRLRPVQLRDLEFLRASTDRRIRITVPGPFTMAQLAQDDFYGSKDDLALAFAGAVNEEMRDLAVAGADLVQLDEPYLQVRPDEARAYGLAAIERALDGVNATTALHTCFGYGYVVRDKPDGYPLLEELNALPVDQVSIEAAQPRLDLASLELLPSKTIVLGVLSLADDAPVETADDVARRAEAALDIVAAERLWLAPDCGMKYLSRDVAFAKLRAMVDGAAVAAVSR